LFSAQKKTKRETMGPFRIALGCEPKRLDLTVLRSGSKPREVSSRMVLDEDAFVSMLYLERRRAERTQKRYVLMLVDVKDAISDKWGVRTWERVTQTLCETTRETDIIGWYLQDNLIGVIGTEIGQASSQEVREVISAKFHRAFSQALEPALASHISVSFHFFPEERENGDSGNSVNMKLYPDLRRATTSRKLSLGVKRAMDIAGSACALILLSPLVGLIALAIKATSKGPVLFRQERLGQYGKTFMVLKFRSMRTDCDSQIHQEYVSRFIAGQVSNGNGNGEKSVFKIQKDPRVTPIGSLLRRTSLDELPQFWNVLTGAMSLVGPRPPVDYEFRAYDAWHRRRVLEIKPGITGLWQVDGRSRTQFDDMVRLDLKYARKWSIWLDLKILLQTPAAVVSGDGAH
jgi:lipopolysaccharide/colanic/teichoic acid biosynthesis glycosyltransferase